MRLRPIFALIGLVVVVSPRASHADRHIFGFTYPYMTNPAGARELEYYLDVGLVPEADVTPALPEGTPAPAQPLTDLRAAYRHQIEFEYGITDRTDLGFYNVLEQDVGQPLTYEGVKLRSRHRFAEQGELPVDVAVYGELEYFGNEYAIEEKLIVAKTVRRIEIDFNLTLEQELEREAEISGTPPNQVASNETVFTFGIVPSLGLGFHVRDWVAAGLELAPEIELGGETEFTSAFGPTVSFMGNGFWWTIAGQFRVHSEEASEGGASTYKDSTVLIRSLLGIVL